MVNPVPMQLEEADIEAAKKEYPNPLSSKLNMRLDISC
jgi:hypothetical protein